MKKTCSILIGISSLFLITGCTNPSQPPAKKETKQQSTEHLDYQEQEHWKFESGNTQSPINIDTSETLPMKDTGDIQIDYQTAVQSEEDNGHSIQVNATGTATINGRRFDFSQVHFHAPSEHTLNGNHYPIEAHFVHKGQNGRLAVIGVFFQKRKRKSRISRCAESCEKRRKKSRSRNYTYTLYDANTYQLLSLPRFLNNPTTFRKCRMVCYARNGGSLYESNQSISKHVCREQSKGTTVTSTNRVISSRRRFLTKIKLS
ncbi:carbonic anhydrase family protein [Bacillus cereus]